MTHTTGNRLKNDRSNKLLDSRARTITFLVAFVLVFVTGLTMLLAGLNARARGPASTPTATPAPVQTPVLAPTVHVSPAEGVPGALIVVTGEGWPPGEQVLVHLEALSDGETQVFVALPTVADDGGLTAPFLFPSDERLLGVPYVVVVVRSPSTGAEGMAVLQVAGADQPDLPTPTATLPLTPTQPVATAEPTAQSSPAPTDQPQPTPAAGCVDKAAFVSDVTIPDNTYLSPGQSFVKTWRLRNAGTCIWTTDYALVFAGGDDMDGPVSAPLGRQVAPGETVDLSVALTAPARNATYESKWRLQDGDDKLFGTGSDGSGAFWVRIIVGPTPTPVPIIANWRGEYYSNRYLTGSPALVRDDKAIDFDWGNASPVTGVPADGFSVRWTRTLPFGAGTYRFYAHSDDGVRVWLDGALIFDQWRDASGTTYSVERALSAGSHTIRVEYYENGGVAKIQFWWEQLGSFSQWRAEYFSNATLAGTPSLVRNDATVDFDWGRGAPATGIPADGFSVRWTRVLGFEEGLYRFHVLVDDGVRLYVDGKLVINAWSDGGRREVVGDHALAAGNHTVWVEYYERSGDALIRMWWEKVNAYPDWRGEYWSNRNLSGSPALVRNDAAIDFSWSLGAPAPGLPTDDFSARWTRTAEFDAATYRFRVLADDGVRLWVNDRLIIDDWRDSPAHELTVDHALTKGTHRLRVEFYEHTGDAQIRVRWEKVGSTSYPEWKGEYWSNRRLNGNPALVRNDEVIDFRWDAGSPATGLPADDFSARWSRRVDFRPGLYRLQAWADDGIRVYVDGKLVLDEWHTSRGDDVYIVDLPLRDRRQVVVEYYERGGNALVKFWWKRIGDLPTPTPSPSPTPTVPPTNRPPLAGDDSIVTDEDTRAYANVLANDSDPDGDPLTVSGYQTISARGGTVSCTSAGMCTYTPPANFNGGDTFAYTVSDGRDHTDTGMVTVVVNPVNDPPVAADDAIATHKNGPVDVNVLANDSDPDGDTLTISAHDTASAQGGTVRCPGEGTCTYNPPVNFIGSDSFGYTVSDGQGGTDTGVVAVIVYPGNGPPVAVDDSATTAENIPVDINVLANDSDPDGDPLTVGEYDSRSSNGGAVGCTNAGLCVYTPPRHFHGKDSFRYTASDGNGGIDAATVTVVVNRVLLPTPEPTPTPTPVPLTPTPVPPTPTPMPPTPTPKPTPAPPAGVRLNEVLPVPAPVDLNSDGLLAEPDEWIELHNAGPVVVDIGGWFLDDGEGGSMPYRIPKGTVLQPGAFAVFYGRETGVVLDDDGDHVRLLGPDGGLLEAVIFGRLAANGSYSRGPDGVWHTDWPPSPGAPNLPPQPNTGLQGDRRVDLPRAVGGSYQ